MKKQKIIISVLGIILGGMCGFIGFEAIEALVSKKGLGMPEIMFGSAAIMAIMYIAFFMHIFIHESGHMIFGLLTGYRFSSIRFLSFMFVKSESGSIEMKRFKVAGTGGQCLMLPPEVEDGTYPYLLYNMGGCILNFLTGSLAIAAGIMADAGMVSAILYIMGIVGVFSCLVNGIPLKQVSNDGYNALTFSKSKTALKVFWIQLNITERQSRGIAASDMPDSWFSYMEQIKEFDNHINISAYVMAISRYEEKGDFEKVKQMCIYAEENIKEMLPVHEGIIKALHLFSHLVTDRDSNKIEELTGEESLKLYKLLATQVSMSRIWYAYYLLYKDDRETAQKYLDKVIRAEKTYPYPADYENEKKLMSYVDKQAV